MTTAYQVLMRAAEIADKVGCGGCSAIGRACHEVRAPQDEYVRARNYFEYFNHTNHYDGYWWGLPYSQRGHPARVLGLLLAAQIVKAKGPLPGPLTYTRGVRGT